MSIPFSDLEKLRMDSLILDKMEKENQQLRRELEGMRNMYYELLTEFSDLRREVRGR